MPPERSPGAFSIEGPLDAGAVDRLDAALIDFSGDEVVVDLSDVGFTESDGIHGLVLLSAELRKVGRSLRLVDCPPRLIHLLELTGLDGVLDAHPTDDDLHPREL